MSALQGIRILEHGTFITGPMASMILADLGAEVIKIEQPGTGDPLRAYTRGSDSAHFLACNRNKRSIALDLKASPQDRRVFERLVARSDVYIQNFRAGVAERLGVGWTELRKLHPQLVYCSVTGLGGRGRQSTRPCYDTVAQAASGFLNQMLSPDRPRIGGPAIADMVTAQYAAIGILASLRKRDASGEGQLVELSMLESMMYFNIDAFTQYLAGGVEPTPSSRPDSSQAFIVHCADGKLIALHLSTLPKFWQALAAVLEAPELLTDPRFSTRQSRLSHMHEVTEHLNAKFARYDRDVWCKRLAEQDLPFAAVLSPAEVVQDAHVHELGVLLPVAGGKAPGLRSVRSPFRLNGQRQTQVRHPPALDEHRVEITAELKGDTHG